MTTMDLPFCPTMQRTRTPTVRVIGSKPVGPSDETKSAAMTWRFARSPAQAVEVRLIREEDGTFSVYVPALPGVMSQGGTEDEAMAMIREAWIGAMKAYRRLKEEPPMSAPEPCEEGEEVRWLALDSDG